LGKHQALNLLVPILHRVQDALPDGTGIAGYEERSAAVPAINLRRVISLLTAASRDHVDDLAGMHRDQHQMRHYEPHKQA
jgi:hypothetical protein